MTSQTRDALSRVVAELGESSLEDALRVVLFEWESARAIARLAADPETLADYQHEARSWAETDAVVDDDPWPYDPALDGPVEASDLDGSSRRSVA